jgi:hypothetical protein
MAMSVTVPDSLSHRAIIPFYPIFYKHCTIFFEIIMSL